MTPTTEIRERLNAFRSASDFTNRGGVITDLDGTALHEAQGRLFIAESVAEGLKAVAELGRPVVLNTLRFPLNVVRTFGREWSAITPRPVPLVTLNGAMFGLLTPEGEAEVRFEEISATPLSGAEIDAALEHADDLIAGGLTQTVIFIYPRDWRLGEIIWTPVPEHVASLEAKYLSASEIISGPLEDLARKVLSHETCMLAVQVDIPEDRRMAYQHVNPNQFVTPAGVDKLSGAREAAARLDFDLHESVGAGDTPMDRFLDGVGLALQVGPLELPYRGRLDTLRLENPAELGRALFEIARGEAPAAKA